MTTYVTPEEYEKMTPAERERLHASVGAQVSASWGGKPAAQPVAAQDLDKAMSQKNEK